MNEFDGKARTWDSDPAKVERAQRVAEAIRGTVGSLTNREVLEYGCGTGLLGFALRAEVAHLTLADTSQGMLQVLEEKIAACGARNVTSLALDLSIGPLPEIRFDLICTLMTLHHIPDTAAILARFHALLRARGALCIADLDLEDGSFHGPDFEGHKGFDREALTQKMLEAGFQNIRFTTPCVVVRQTPTGVREFPVFLMVGEKAG